MTFIDDNYLDGVITRMTQEHREILLRTAKRLNLPDDDMMFLYIGAIEYTVQLCEDILSAMSQERQAMTVAADKARQDASEETKNLIKTLLKVGHTVVAEIQKSGMATTSAIAEANQEVLSKSLATVSEAQLLKDQLQAFRDSVEQDRVTNEEVLTSLLRRVGKTISDLEQATQKIETSHAAIQKLQERTKLIKWAEWFSPLAALLLAAGVGAAVYGWGLHQYWGESEKYLSVIKKNQAAFDKCFNSNGLVKLGLDCQILYHKAKK